MAVTEAPGLLSERREASAKVLHRCQIQKLLKKTLRIEVDRIMAQDVTKDSAYEIKTSEKVGRFLVCKRNLKRGEEFLSELPLVVGPKQITFPLCLGCLAPVDASVLCESCGWPVCDPSCATWPAHKDNECPIFTKAKSRFQIPSCTEGGPSGPSPQYECVTVLRMLLAKERDAERWAKDVEPMQDHLDKRKGTERWAVEETNVVKYLAEHCQLADRFPASLIWSVIGILGVNSFEVPGPSGANVLAVYPKAAVMSHNCVANTSHSAAPDKDYRLTVRAAVDLKQGDELFCSYTSFLQPTMLRREHLSETKFFECDCTRCSDPTELGTNASSLKCTKCDLGVIKSTAPLDSAADWRCSHCEFNLRGEQIRRIYTVIQNETEEAESEGLEALERLLKQYRSVLHPKHALVLAIKHSLAHLYGRADGYSLDDLPDIILERKAEFCREVLSTVDVVQPGCTRLRGLLLYELHVPMILHARSSYQQGSLSQELLREKLQAAADVLQEAKDILVLEDEGTPEGAVGRVAENALQQLQMSIETLPLGK